MNILVINQKGGVGKTTIVNNLAVYLLQHQQKILLIDADPQSSSMFFREKRSSQEVSSYECVQITSPTIHQDIEGLKKSYDHVLIDIGGRDNKTFRSAIAAADACIIPTQPSMIDFDAFRQTANILEEIRLGKPQIKVIGVLNRVKKTSNQKELEKIKTSMYKEFKIPFLNQNIYDRIVYSYAMGYGLSVLEGDDRLAKIEFQDFGIALCQFLKIELGDQNG